VDTVVFHISILFTLLLSFFSWSTKDAIARPMISILVSIVYAGLVIQSSFAYEHAVACSSPESKRLSLRSNTAVCDYGDSILSNPHLTHVVDELRRLKLKECSDFVIYTASLGSGFSAFIDANGTESTEFPESDHGGYGRCFFSFVLGESTDISISDTEVTVSLSPAHLPYKNMRRNVKILKFLGLRIFSWAKRLVWQDAKLGDGRRFPIMDPMRYFEKTVEAQGSCVSYMGLPVIASTMGNDGWDVLRKADYYRHCEAIVGSSRKDVTDDRAGLISQCLKYIYEAYLETGSMHTLSDHLIDSALIVWDLRPKRCREFNVALQCKWLNEIDCFSDRDQVSFPYVLYQMKLRRYELKTHALFVDATNNTVVQIVDKRCHWYFTENAEKCIDISQQPERMALLISGSLHQFQLKSILKLLLKPLKSRGFEVDVYARLHMSNTREHVIRFLKSNPFLGTDPYLLRNRTFVEDAFESAFVRSGYQRKGLRDLMYPDESGLRHISLLSHVDAAITVKSDKRIRLVRQEAKLRHPDEDADLRFPLNKATTAVPEDAEVNKDLISRYISLENLWDLLLDNEVLDRRQYQHVLFLCQDAPLNSDIVFPHPDPRKFPDITHWMYDRSSLFLSRRIHADFFAHYLSTLMDIRNDCISRDCSSDALLRLALQKYQRKHPDLTVVNATSLVSSNLSFYSSIEWIEKNMLKHDKKPSSRSSVWVTSIAATFKYLFISVLVFGLVRRVASAL